MMHRICITCAVRGGRQAARLIRKAVRATLKEENVNVPCQIGIKVTGDDEIHELNWEHRGVDSATDVLSFPMMQLEPGNFKIDEKDLDPGTGRLYLGDMVISLDRARVQAKEYGHSLARETAYLSVHSVLHLLGYDHEDDIPEKRRMRAREERIMQQLKLRRKYDK